MLPEMSITTSMSTPFDEAGGAVIAPITTSVPSVRAYATPSTV